MSTYSGSSVIWQTGYAAGYRGESVEALAWSMENFREGYAAGEEDYENDAPDMSGGASWDSPEADFGGFPEDLPEWRPTGDAPMGCG